MPLNPPNSFCLRQLFVNPKQARYQNVFRLALWLLFGATLVAVTCARIRLLGLPLERDEGEYAYTGQLLLQGIPPYKLAYSMKFPGTAASYALLMSIFGDTTSGIHLGLIVINLVTVGLIFFLGRYLLSELAGLAAAAAYGVISLMPYVLGQAAHATHFVVLPAIAGASVLLRALDRQSRILILASGCLFGLALLMKQPGLFFVLFGVVYLFSHDRSEHVKLRQSALRSLIFLLGVTVPLLVTCLLLWNIGVFEKFWFWTIKYAGQYGSQVSIADGLRILANNLPNAVGTAWPIWAIAASGLVICMVNRTLRTRAVFLTTFAFFSILAVCPGFYFRPHYFILVLPAVSLLAGAAVAALSTLFASAHRTFALPCSCCSDSLWHGQCGQKPTFSSSDHWLRPIGWSMAQIHSRNPLKLVNTSARNRVCQTRSLY